MFEMIIGGYRWIFLQMASVLGPGWAIITLSFICSALMAPLMRAVAGIVRREADYQTVIDPQVAAIRAKYASDMDRHLHIQRLYSRYGYSPLSPVKKVLPLFVQIPFLLLTYCMLKGTAQLNGVSFLFLADLGAPDCLIVSLGLIPLKLNVLPFVMTGVNLLTVVATSGFTSRDQFQAVAISLLFLAMLYTAPSALLLYWTLNNVITLVRTLIRDRFAGVRLIAERFMGLRSLPKVFPGLFSERILAFLGLVLLTAALYMRLMVFLEVWWFNYVASYFGMVFALTGLVWTTFLMHRHGVKRMPWVVKAIVTVATLLAVVLVGAMASIVVSFSMLGILTQRVGIDRCFDFLFLAWILQVLILNVRSCKRPSVGFARLLRSQGHWLVLSVVLAVHYSFASVNFKLTWDSVLVLIFYLMTPCVAFAALCVFAFRRQLPEESILRLAIGVVIGAFLVPMVSLESGKLLGWQCNLVARFLFLAVVAVAVNRLNRQRPAMVFLGLLLAMVSCRAVFCSFRVMHESKDRSQLLESEAQRTFKNVTCIHSNSVYLLIYDSYGHDRIHDKEGVRTAGIRDLLGKRGFTSYDAYSIGSDTVASMGTAFDLGGVKQGSARSMMAGNNPFNDFLQRSGYRTSYILSDYDMPNRGERKPGDYYFPAAQEIKRQENVLFPCIVRGFLSQTPDVFSNYTQDEWVAAARREMAAAGPFNRFVYAHSSLPGHVIADPVYRKAPEVEARNYERRVAAAEKEMSETLDLLLGKDDESIIVVASDHGPLLRCTKEVGVYDKWDILDRCGIQLHIRWPKDYKPCLKLDCLQNVFLEVMIYLSGDRSLSRFESNGESLYIQYPVKAPPGAVRRGVIRTGKSKGESLVGK